jgi:D-beta-D-heptose 7-phosphate kinase/D-beta-D-heptose 1-phosphate adenosyltransferase
MTPNLGEALQLCGKTEKSCSMNQIPAVGQTLLQTSGSLALLITLGAQGMMLFEQVGHSPRHIPAAARKVYDVTGAGDTVIATYTAAYCAGSSPAAAAHLANLAAGLSVAQQGTAAPSLAELQQEWYRE